MRTDYRRSAYRSAVQHPYHVCLYADWSAGALVVGFQSEEEARSFVARRPEPIADLVRRGHGVIAIRRTIPHPASQAGMPFYRDDFEEED